MSERSQNNSKNTGANNHNTDNRSNYINKKISVEYINQRLDNYLIRELKPVPKGLIYKLIRKKAIRVNNRKTTPDYKLLLNDEVSYPELRSIEKLNSLEQKQHLKSIIPQSLIENIKARIIIEHKDFIIINKPAGLAVHAGSNVNYGLIDVLRKIYGNRAYLELVHRLDRDTSGCIVIAKNRIALVDLHDKLQNSEITKTYLALTKGIWSNSKRLLKHPLKKSALRSGERMVVVDYDNGKESLTKVEIDAIRNNTSLLELTAITGRTHQLRVHCAHEGHPIIGDEKYGDKEFNKQLVNKLKNTNEKAKNRLFLHAYKIEFAWEKNRNLICVTAPLDNNLEQILSHLDYL